VFAAAGGVEDGLLGLAFNVAPFWQQPEAALGAFGWTARSQHLGAGHTERLRHAAARARPAAMIRASTPSTPRRRPMDPADAMLLMRQFALPLVAREAIARTGVPSPPLLVSMKAEPSRVRQPTLDPPPGGWGNSAAPQRRRGGLSRVLPQT
jgi:hypothetical protein